MKLKIEFDTPANGCKAVNILNRLTHDLDGKTLRAGQSFALVNDGAEVCGFAKVIREPKLPSQHAASIMEPIIAGTRERGQVKRLIARYYQMTGTPHHYATWMRWLNPNPKFRMEPAVGTALAIQAAFDSLRAEDEHAEAVRAAIIAADKRRTN